MADWPPIPDVPSAVDSPFPPEWQQAQPYSIDGAQPAPETVPPWEQKLPEQQLGASLEALLGAQTPEAQFPPTATPQGNEVAAPPWEQSQAPQNENAPWWAQAAQGTAKQVGAPENILTRKADQENAQKAADPEAAAINEQYRIKAEAERKQAEGELNLARDYKQQLAMDQLQTQREGAAAQAAEQKVGEAWDAVSKANIDPQALWHSMGAAQKVSAVIGAAIGGFLSARQQSGRNQFMDTYNQRVAESIQAQEANLANMRQAAAGQQSVYGMMLDRFKDAQTARHMTAATMYDAGMKELSANLSQFKSPMTQQEGQLALIQLQKGRDGALAAAQQQQFDNTLKLDEQARKDAETAAENAKRQAEIDKMRRQGVGGGKKPTNSLGTVTDVNADGKVDKLDLTDEQRKLAVYDTFGQPLTDPQTGALITGTNAEHAARLGKGLAAAKQARAALAEYDRLRHSYGREMGGGKGWTEGARKMNAQRSLAMKSIKTAWELGAITDSDYTLINGAIPGVPGDTDVTINHEALPRVIEDLDVGVDSTMNQLGYSGSYSQAMQGRVHVKPGAVAEEPQTGQVVDIRTPQQKAAEDRINAAKAEQEGKAAKQEQGKANLDAVASDFGGGASLLVVSKGKTMRVRNDEAAQKALKSKKYRLATIEEQQAYQPPSLIEGQ